MQRNACNPPPSRAIPRMSLPFCRRLKRRSSSERAGPVMGPFGGAAGGRNAGLVGLPAAGLAAAADAWCWAEGEGVTGEGATAAAMTVCLRTGLRLAGVPPAADDATGHRTAGVTTAFAVRAAVVPAWRARYEGCWLQNTVPGRICMELSLPAGRFDGEAPPAPACVYTLRPQTQSHSHLQPCPAILPPAAHCHAWRIASF